VFFEKRKNKKKSVKYFVFFKNFNWYHCYMYWWW